MDLGDRNHRLFQGIDVARDDGLDRLHHAYDGHHGINAFMRRGPMTTFAGNGDIGRVNRRHQRPGCRIEMPERHVRRVMDTVDLTDGKTVHYAFLHHHLTAAAILFRRLENQGDGAGKVPRFGQIFGSAQQHCHMAVMPAGVHLARHCAGVGRASHLGNRERVHVGAQSDHRAV